MTVKIISILLLVVPFQASALFFHDFHHSFFEVEHHLGRLLTSAVEDVKEAIDCTVSAIENVLSLGGLLDSFNSRHRTRCHPGRDGSRDFIYTDDPVSGMLPIEKVSQDIGKRTENWREQLSHGIKGSILRINESLSEFINRDATGGLQYIEEEMRNDTDHLLKVSMKLRNELDRLTEKANEHIKNIDFNPYQATVSDVMNEIKVLHNYEKNKDTTGALEVRNVLNEVLDEIYSKNTHPPNLSSNNQYEDIVKDLEKNKFSIMKERKAAPNYYKERGKFNTNKKIISFKDLFNKNTPVSDSNSPSVVKSSKIKEKTNKTVDPNELVNLYFGPKDEEDHKKTAEEAQDIFEQSEMARSFMDDIFSNSDKQAVDVFDNPDLLNSG